MYTRDVIEVSSESETDVVTPRPDAARGPDAGINGGNKAVLFNAHNQAMNR